MLGLETPWLFDVIRYVGAIATGLLAGFINTLAGNGSAITLPMLMMLGLDPKDANATNRIGVMFSSATASYTFKRGGLLETKGMLWWIIPSVLGSLIGAAIAVWIEPQNMKIAVAVVMVFVLLLVLFKPQRWIKDNGPIHANHRKASSLLIFLLIGIYGGFIQMGVGVLLLAALVLKGGYSLVRANPIKVTLVCAFTLPALILFVANKQVQVYWSYGLLMACGQAVGAWSAAKYAPKHPRANIWIRRLLIVMIVVSLFKLILFDLRSGKNVDDQEARSTVTPTSIDIPLGKGGSPYLLVTPSAPLLLRHRSRSLHFLTCS